MAVQTDENGNVDLDITSEARPGEYVLIDNLKVELDDGSLYDEDKFEEEIIIDDSLSTQNEEASSTTSINDNSDLDTTVSPLDLEEEAQTALDLTNVESIAQETQSELSTQTQVENVDVSSLDLGDMLDVSDENDIIAQLSAQHSEEDQTQTNESDSENAISSTDESTNEEENTQETDFAELGGGSEGFDNPFDSNIGGFDNPDIIDH